MSWIDTGVNLLDPRFTLADVLLRAAQAKVNNILVISSTLGESEQALALCKKHNHPPVCESIHVNDLNKQLISKVKLACTAGIHPHYADQAKRESWTKLNALSADNHITAIGECGLDFNRNFSTRTNQLYAFEQQLNIAANNNMGVYLHERDAFDEQMILLEQYAPSLKFMVTHCFTGNKEQLNGYLSLGCYVGITGWLCDEKRGQQLREAVLNLPLSRLLLETDAPYLFPKTLKPRKSKNEPCFLPHIAESLSEIINVDISTIEKHAFDNAFTLFFS
ncbi:MAG: TatD DNase family protein [Alphaproteobacteria bacterium]|jgi:TatD DNase family protein